MLSFDIDTIKEAGYPVTTPIIVTNTANYKQIEVLAKGEVQLGNQLLELKIENEEENGGSMPQFGDCSTLLPAPAFCFAFL